MLTLDNKMDCCGQNMGIKHRTYTNIIPVAQKAEHSKAKVMGLMPSLELEYNVSYFG